MGGWVTLILVVIASIYIAIKFYYIRWKWICKWKYTTSYGVMCFYEPGTSLYTRREVDLVTSIMFQKWDAYFDRFGTPPSQRATRGSLIGVICTFRPEAIFNQQIYGFKDRLVFGISGWKWMIIGTGNRPLEKTAYMHESSHIHLNSWKGRQIPDDEAHPIFETVGI